MSAVMPETPGLGLPRASAIGSAALHKAAPVATSTEAPAPTLSPEERLEASRARLRGALLEIAHPTPAPVGDGLLDGLKDKLLRTVQGLPGASIVLESIESWWAQHPLHTAGVVAKEASQEFIVPLARRNPFMLLLGATAIGALFVASRPWRWLLRPALFMGLVPQLASHALRRMPIDSWIHLVSRIASKPKPTTASSAAARNVNQAGGR